MDGGFTCHFRYLLHFGVVRMMNMSEVVRRKDVRHKRWSVKQSSANWECDNEARRGNVVYSDEA